MVRIATLIQLVHQETGRIVQWSAHSLRMAETWVRIPVRQSLFLYGSTTDPHFIAAPGELFRELQRHSDLHRLLSFGMQLCISLAFESLWCAPT